MDDDDKLKLLGWGRHKAKTSLGTPGQCRTLEASPEDEGEPSNTVMAVL